MLDTFTFREAKSKFINEAASDAHKETPEENLLSFVQRDDNESISCLSQKEASGRHLIGNE